MSSVLPQPARRSRPGAGTVVALGAAAALGCVIGNQSQLALLLCALAFVVLAAPFVDGLCVLTFWLLPYLVLSVPAAGLTLKAPELTAYLFMAAALARALLRREHVALPPATLPVLIYLGVLAVSAALAPGIPRVYGDFFGGLQGPELRPFGLLFWLSLSWLVVVGLYHVVGTRPDLFRRCVRAHILTSTFASFIGIVGYCLALTGGGPLEALINARGNARAFVFTGGSFYRLTGVSYEPLLFAFYLVTVIPVTLAVAFYRRDWIAPWLMALSLLLQTVALLLTFSAGGWAALIIALLLMVWLLRPRVVWRKAVPWLLAAAVLVALSVGAFFVNPLLSRVMGHTVGKIMTGGYKMRDDEITTGMSMFRDHLWLGVGLGNTPFYFPRYHPVVRSLDPVSTGWLSVYVNNLYVVALGETGIIGFTALAVCGIVGLGALARAIRRRGPSHAPLLTALTVSLIACAFQYWETQNLFLIYFPALVGLAVAGARLAHAEADRLEAGVGERGLARRGL